MKRTYSLLAMVVATVLLLSCEESDETIERAMTDEEAVQQVLDRIEKNEGISYDLFGVLGDRMDPDSIARLKAASKTKEGFVDILTTQTKAYFEEIVEENKTDFHISATPTPFSGEAEITLKGLASREELSAPPFLDIVGDYSQVILKEVQGQVAAEGGKEWILIDSYETSTATREMPAESISLNFTKVEMLATVPHTVIMNLELTDEEVLETLNDILADHDIPPPAVAMLLPAVQKVREAASASSEPFGNAMEAWLDGTVDPAIGGGLDRDIIRRIQATVFLAGLHTLILQGYPNANQDMASLSILHARYRAALIVATEELWGD